MEPLTQIPDIAMLALRYGTIKKNEFEQVNKLYSESSNKATFNEILVNRGFVTEHQIGLLLIIQEQVLYRKLVSRDLLAILPE